MRLRLYEDSWRWVGAGGAGLLAGLGWAGLGSLARCPGGGGLDTEW